MSGWAGRGLIALALLATSIASPSAAAPGQTTIRPAQDGHDADLPGQVLSLRIDGSTRQVGDIEVVDLIEGLWLWPTDGTDPTPIADDASPLNAPEWLPDGTGFVYVASEGQVDRLMRHDLASGHDHVIVAPQPTPGFILNIGDFDISPSGDRIVYKLQSGVSEVRVIDVDGSNDRVINTTMANLADQPWSPDGTRVFGSCLAPLTCTLMVDVATGSSTSFEVPAGVFAPQAWSPTAEVLAAGAETGEVVLLSPEGEEINRLPAPAFVADATDAVRAATKGYVWSPDGTRIAGSDVLCPTSPLSCSSNRFYVWDVEADSEPSLVANFGGEGVGGTTIGSWSADGSAFSFTISTLVGTPNPERSVGIVHVDLMTWSVLGRGSGAVIRPPDRCDAEPAPLICRVPFVDIATAEDHFALRHIVTLYEREITTGTSPTTYDPSGFVTREQMAAFVARTYRALGGADPTPQATPFLDVPSTSFAAEDIAFIYALGITTGTSPTTYDPSGFVTREQMAAFIMRLFRALDGVVPAGSEFPFDDVAPTSFAYDHIASMVALGITTGTSPTTYDPSGFVTREQMAAFLGRLIDRFAT